MNDCLVCGKEVGEGDHICTECEELGLKPSPVWTTRKRDKFLNFLFILAILAIVFTLSYLIFR